MIGTETLDRVIGRDVYDDSGSKIGSASEVYLDDATGRPEWVTVKTGMFGTKESFVPLRDAALTEDGLRVHVSKDRVKDAPKIDTDGHLSPAEEDELYRYYGITATDTTVAEPGTTMAGTRMEPTAGTAPAGYTEPVGREAPARSTDDAMTRSEERLRVGTETEPERKARLRKYVVTENVTETVPVTREDVVVEREPITDANRDKAMSGPAFKEDEHEVTLHSERPVVEKEEVPVERVRLGKETETENVTVDETLRKEEIEAEGVNRTRER